MSARPSWDPSGTCSGTTSFRRWDAMTARSWLSLAAGMLGVVVWLAAACAPAAAPASGRAPAAPATASAQPPAAAPPVAAAPGEPELAITPPVTLKVGYLAVSPWAPLFLAQERGYFREVGLEIEASPFGNYATQVPLLAQG